MNNFDELKGKLDEFDELKDEIGELDELKLKFDELDVLRVKLIVSHMIQYGVLNFRLINFTNEHCFHRDDISK